MVQKAKHFIVGVHITDRVQHVPSVQNVLTDFGCYIKTRVGLHDASENYCSPNGLIILEMVGDEEKIQEFVSTLTFIPGVDVKQMVFTHE